MAVKNATLFYRPEGSSQPFFSIPLLTSEDLPMLYVGTLSENIIANGGSIEIFVEATDTSGNRTQFPWRSEPRTASVKVTISKSSAPSKRNLALIGLGVLAAGAVIFFASDDSSTSENSSVTITTPLP